ncbi:hypothetical protein ARAM_006933 [Aspergillus rambellii]|uniref:Fe2OG dioxygenase domain-containing protein n=1 Tax=Aspergillus rambellii TaxID=308745 RepID=A0A0F8XMJ8_9EURO|nr:hypothetical protein ARAM_006933 [Aspergillus rambellii]
MPKPKGKPSKSDSQPQKSSPAPNWPPLRPLIPSSDLTLDPILPDQIYLIRNFLPASLETQERRSVRVNDRFQVQDERFADQLWRETALKELVTVRALETEDDDNGHQNHDQSDSGRRSTKTRRSIQGIWGGDPLGLNPNIRVYRYTPGQFFAQHYDDSNALSFLSPSTPPKPGRTTWTLLIYLSTCSGGETVFYPEPTRANRNPEPISVAPEMGMALFHRHGDRCLLHEGAEVTGGEKWVLRSDLVVAR